jgi:hypothetical protein
MRDDGSPAQRQPLGDGHRASQQAVQELGALVVHDERQRLRVDGRRALAQERRHLARGRVEGFFAGCRSQARRLREPPDEHQRRRDDHDSKPHPALVTIQSPPGRWQRSASTARS